ncbi:glycosyltransferase family 4 protein [Inediibacterium massiliense]|uniref:glycosyltransferase family 4 protein n=1 Tax=Inediibacterium massiliense TaxID=1658111 RepID=UPI0006B5540F|nr:MraY family glycosyltransferase [Inediibacterium massiliense]
MKQYFLVFFIGAFVSFLMTPLAKKLACKIGAIDIPKDDRRVHKQPIPRMGGLAIYFGFMISVLMNLPVIDKPMIGMFIGGTFIVLMGIVDDLRPLSAKTKLMGQIVSALILVYCGLRIGMLNIPFIKEPIVFPIWASIMITIFWVVGITNTLNLIDGLDGLAAGVASIAGASLFYVAIVNGRDITPLMTMAIVGACIGFLPYNFNPAKIFMGDTGSLFLGYMLAAISIHGAVKGATAIATVIPVLALGLPIFDTTFAILRRMINGRPIMEPDKGHLHHKLLATGMGQKRTVLVLYGISAIFGASAALMSDSTSWDILLIVIATSALMYISIGMHKEVQKQKSSHKE